MQEIINSISLKEWDEEYRNKKVIPSSHRVAPSKIFTLFSEIADFESPGLSLDIGCGNGRNSIYLAKKQWTVKSIDGSAGAIELAESKIGIKGVRSNISLEHRILKEDWNLEYKNFDLILDSYVLCHYNDNEYIKNFLNQVNMHLKADGLFYSSHFSIDDEYYNKEGIVKDNNWILDPNNTIHKKLYSEDELKSLYSSFFKIKYYLNFKFIDICLGKPYLRSIHGLLLSKR